MTITDPFATPALTRRSLTRRSLTGLLVGLAAAGCTEAHEAPGGPSSRMRSAGSPGVPDAGPVSAYGVHQAGIVDPAPAQDHLAISVLDVGADLLPGIDGALGVLSQVIPVLTARGISALGAPRRLTVTVGVGPRVSQAAHGPDALGAEELPHFRREALTPAATGGDLMVQICGDDLRVVRAAQESLERQLAPRLRVRWRASGFAHAAAGEPPRNLLGFHDGISNPATDANRNATVWIGTGPLAGGTLAVVREIVLDTAGFARLSVAEQEAVIGRHKASGAPLSGGGMRAQPDLQARDASGNYLIPLHAHVRRAHPLLAGLPGLMLRRGYNFRRGQERGLVFVSFQNHLDLFSRTQSRMDQGDALVPFLRIVKSGTFAVLPGFARTSPLALARV